MHGSKGLRGLRVLAISVVIMGTKGWTTSKERATMEMLNQQQRLNRNLEANAGFVECQVIGRVSVVVI